MADYLDKNGLDTLIGNIKAKDDELSLKINESIGEYNSLLERVEEIEEAIREVEAVNYVAIYSADDDSLTFYIIADDVMPKEKGTFMDKTVTKIYTVPLNDIYGDYDLIPWRDDTENFRSVIIDSSFSSAKVASTSMWFLGFINLTSIDLRWLDSTHVTNMYMMFYDCESLETLDLSWLDTANTTNMAQMFRQCYGLTEIDVSGFNTSKVANMDYMFMDCTSLTTIYSNDTMFVTTGLSEPHWSTFYGCENLVGGNGTKYDESNSSSSMAHIDTEDNPGYFTAAVGVSSVGVNDTIYYGRCLTAATEEIKEVNIDGFKLEHGVHVTVFFVYGNSADEPCIDISGTGPIEICGVSTFTGNNYLTLVYDDTNSMYYAGLAMETADAAQDTANDAIERARAVEDSAITGIIVNGEYAPVEDNTAEITIQGDIVYYGTCTTSASADIKNISCDASELYAGLAVLVRFDQANQSNNVSLNVNNLGERNIFVNNAIVSDSNYFRWGSNTTIMFIYDGKYWHPINIGRSFYGSSSAINYDYQSKNATVNDYVLTKGTLVNIHFSYRNEVDEPTLNISGSGAIPIIDYVDWENGETVSFYFNGADYVAESIASKSLVKNAQNTADRAQSTAYTALGMVNGIHDTVVETFSLDYEPDNDSSSETLGITSIQVPIDLSYGTPIAALNAWVSSPNVFCFAGEIVDDTANISVMSYGSANPFTIYVNILFYSVQGQNICVFKDGKVVRMITKEEFDVLQEKAGSKTLRYTNSEGETVSVTENFVLITDIVPDEYQPDEGCGFAVYGLSGDTTLLGTDAAYIYYDSGYCSAIDYGNYTQWISNINGIEPGHVFSSRACRICGAEEA